MTPMLLIRSLRRNDNSKSYLHKKREFPIRKLSLFSIHTILYPCAKIVSFHGFTDCYILVHKKTSTNFFVDVILWAMRDSNPRPSGCKPDALNQLS